MIPIDTNVNLQNCKNTSVGYQTGNHYRLSEYTGRLIIDYTIENYTHFTKNSNFHKTNMLHVHMAML